MNEITTEMLKTKAPFVQKAFEVAQAKANDYIANLEFLWGNKGAYRTRMFPNGVHIEMFSQVEQRFITTKIIYLGE